MKYIMDTYKLVNPVILGTFPQTFSGGSPLDGAVNFWTKLTGNKDYIINTFPKYHFTMQDNNKELFHFKVKESIVGGSKKAKWNISQINVDITEAEKKELIKQSNNVSTLSGGSKKKHKKHHKKDDDEVDDDLDDSDSSSSSSSLDDSDDSDDEDAVITKIKMNQIRDPISFWWYAPSVYKVKSYYGPVFPYYSKPYVEYWVPQWNL